MTKVFLTFILLFFQGRSVLAEGPTITQKKLPGRFKFSEVEPGSLYYRVGVRSNDIVKTINGKPATDETKLDEIIQLIHSGGILVVERKSKIKKIKIKATPE